MECEQNRDILNKLIAFNERIKKEKKDSVTMEPNNSKLKKVKDISQKLVNTTAFYGLKHINKAESRLMKMIWTVMTLVSLSAGLFIIAKTMDSFYQNDVFTQTKRMQPEYHLMPSVTFCSDATNLHALVNRAQFIETNRSTDLTGIDFYEDNLNTAAKCIKFNNYRNNGDSLFYNKDSNDDHFKFYIDLNVDFRTIDVFFSDNYLNVLDWSQLVTGIGNKAKGSYYVDVSKIKEQKLEEPYNHCELIADETYRQANCLAQCKNNKAISRFNCTLRNYFSRRAFDYCAHAIHETFQLDTDCAKDCPLECHSTKFDAIVSNYVTSAGPNDSVKFSISYLDSSYIEMSQSPKMNAFTLISSIGGALGLFIGIRFLSMVELLEYLTEIFFVYYR